MTLISLMRRSAILVFLCLMGSSLTAAPISIESVRLGFADKNSFKLGTWTPIRLVLKADQKTGFSGTLEISTSDDAGTSISVRQPLTLSPGQTQRVTSYIRPGGREPNLSFRFLDTNGKRVSSDGPPGQTIYDVIGAEETVLLTLGKTQGVELIPTLSGYSADQTASTRSIVVEPIDLGDDQLPGRWYGYDSVEAVILDTNSAEAMTALSGRGKALRDWVERGGHLVLSVGENWQGVVDANSELRDLLPALPAGQSRINDLGVIESFAASSNPIVAGQAALAGLQIARLTEVDKRGGKVLAATASLPLIVRGSFGFGRVTLIALDVNQNPFASWVDRALFWDKAIDLKRTTNVGTISAITRAAGRLTSSGNTDLGGLLRRGLEQFPGIKLVPFGWVAFFIFLYILLIGPGDYFFLKKVVKRMEFTWITFPIIVIAVSTVAYFAAYSFKGTDLRVNKIDAVDIDQTTGTMRGRTWANVFSPQNRDYKVAFSPLLIGADPAKVAPEVETLLGWYSSPEVAFGGMGGGGRVGFSGGGYGYESGKLDELINVRIAIWSTKCFTARWFGPAEPVIESELVAVGVDQLNGTVTNRLGKTLNNAVLCIGARAYDLGTIAPGATTRVELTPDRTLAGYLKSLNVSSQAVNGSINIDRVNLIRTLMFNDAIGGGPEQLANAALDDMDLSGQLVLDRPMLVARIDGPAVELRLNGSESNAKIDQTTLVRIILPLTDSKRGK